MTQFQEQLDTCPKGLADWIINVVKTAKALQYGLEGNSMKVSDETLLEEAVSIVTAWQENPWEDDED